MYKCLDQREGVEQDCPKSMCCVIKVFNPFNAGKLAARHRKRPNRERYLHSLCRFYVVRILSFEQVNRRYDIWGKYYLFFWSFVLTQFWQKHLFMMALWQYWCVLLMIFLLLGWKWVPVVQAVLLWMYQYKCMHTSYLNYTM